MLERRRLRLDDCEVLVNRWVVLNQDQIQIQYVHVRTAKDPVLAFRVIIHNVVQVSRRNACCIANP